MVLNLLKHVAPFWVEARGSVWVEARGSDVVKLTAPVKESKTLYSSSRALSGRWGRCEARGSILGSKHVAPVGLKHVAPCVLVWMRLITNSSFLTAPIDIKLL